MVLSPRRMHRPPPCSPKLLRVLNGAVAQADAQAAPLLEHVLQQQWLQGRVQLLAHILEEDRVAKLRGGRGGGS